MPSSMVAGSGTGLESIGTFEDTRWHSASWSEPMHYSDRWSQQMISINSYPDGSMEQVLEGTGQGNLLGHYKVRTVARLTPSGVNLLARSALFVVVGETHSTVIDGSILSTQFSGRLTMPLDTELVPAAGLRPFSVRWSVIDGTGRFAEVAGDGMFTGAGTSEGRFDGVSWGTLRAPSKSARVWYPHR